MPTSIKRTVPYMAEHGLALAGPVRETYVVGRRDTADTSRWRTEICWPI